MWPHTILDRTRTSVDLDRPAVWIVVGIVTVPVLLMVVVRAWADIFLR